jgi:hypothetical protein
METMTLAPATRKQKRAVRRHADMVGAVECTLLNLIFPVEIRNEEMPSNSEYSRMVVGKINGGDFKLNQCSPRYELFPNREIFPKIERILNKHNIQYKATYSHINHVRFYVEYQITDSRYSYRMRGTNDIIFPMLKVQHSYNGVTKYKIIFGYFRFVCTNGLTIPVQEMKRFNLAIVGKHTEAIKRSFAQLNEMLKFFVAEADLVIGTITQRYETLGGRMVVNPKDRITEVLKATKIIAVVNNKFNTVDDILLRITEELKKPELAGYNHRINDWLIYNGINQYVNDNKRNIAAPEVRIETDSKVLEYMLENA